MVYYLKMIRPLVFLACLTSVLGQLAIAPNSTRRVYCPTAAHYFNFNASSTTDYIQWNPLKYTLQNGATFNATEKTVGFNAGGYVNFSPFGLGASAITVAGWFNVEQCDLQLNDQANLFSFGSGTGSQTDYIYPYIYVSLLCETLVQGLEIGYGFYDVGITARANSLASVSKVWNASNLGKWNHIAAVYSTNGYLKLYFNGIQILSALNDDAVAVPVQYYNRTTAYVGASQYVDVNNGLADGVVDGSVADIGIYFQELNATTIAGLAAGSTAACPVLPKTTSFNISYLGQDATSLSPSYFRGTMADFQVYAYNLAGGTDSCAPAPPPAPPLPPAPPSPRPPPPHPPQPPGLVLTDTAVFGTLRLHFAKGFFSFGDVVFTDQYVVSRALQQSLTGYLSVSPNPCLVLSYSDGNYDDFDQSTAYFGFSCKTKNTLAELTTQLNSIIPTTTGDATLGIFNSLGFDGQVVSITYYDSLYTSSPTTSVYPGVGTTVLFNATSIDFFDANFERALSVGITAALGLATASIFVTGVAYGEVVGTYSVGIYITQPTLALAAQAMTDFNGLIPSPNGDIDSYFTLITAVNGAGVPFVAEIKPLTRSVGNALVLNYTAATDYTVMTVTIAGPSLSDLDAYGMAVLESAIASVVDASPDTVEITGVSQIPGSSSLLVGVALASAPGEISAQNAVKLQTAAISNNALFLRYARSVGLPQVTSLGLNGQYYTRVPPPKAIDLLETYVATTIYLTINGDSSGLSGTITPPQNASIASGVGATLGVSNMDVFVMGGYKFNATTTAFGLMIKCNSSALASSLSASIPTKTMTSIKGLPQVAAASFQYATIGMPDNTALDFARPCITVSLALGYELSYVSTGISRVLEAAFAKAYSISSSKYVAVRDLTILSSGKLQVSLGIVTATQSALIDSTVTKSSPTNPAILALLQGSGAPFITSLDTTDSGSNALVLPAVVAAPYAYSLSLGFTGMSLNPIEYYAAAAGLASAVGGPASAFYVNNAISISGGVQVGFTVNGNTSSDVEQYFMTSATAATSAALIAKMIAKAGSPATTAATVSGISSINYMTNATDQTIGSFVVYKLPEFDAALFNKGGQQAVLNAFMKKYGLSSGCCAAVGGAYAPGGGTYAGVFVPQAGTYSGVPDFFSYGFPVNGPTFVAQYDYQEFTTTPAYAVSFSILMRSYSQYGAIHSKAAVAVLCSQAGLGVDCAEITGFYSNTSDFQVGVIMQAESTTQAAAYLTKVDSLFASPTFLSVIKTLLPAITNVSYDRLPGIWAQGTIGNTPQTLSFSMTIYGMDALSIGQQLSLITGIAAYTKHPTNRIIINGITSGSRRLLQTGLSIGFSVDVDSAADAANITTALTTNQIALVSTIQTLGLPQITAAIVQKTSISSITEYKPTVPYYAFANLLLTGVSASDLQSKGTTQAFLGAVADVMSIDPTCISITNPDLQSVELKAVSVDSALGVFVTCKTAGKPFTSDLEALAINFNAYFPSPGVSASFITTINSAGVPQLVAAQLGSAPPPPPPPRPPYPPPVVGIQKPVVTGIASGAIVVVSLVVTLGILNEYTNTFSKIKSRKWRR